jgi:hypothetical protein
MILWASHWRWRLLARAVRLEASTEAANFMQPRCSSQAWQGKGTRPPVTTPVGLPLHSLNIPFSWVPGKGSCSSPDLG